MFAPKRLERAYDYSREQSKKRNEGQQPEDNPVQLEKGDITGMILGAFIVFAPIFLVLLGLILLTFIFL
ncbi:MAG TPA: hypothetical protein GXZ74_08560 [Tissierellia bacterium]|nr:hypothetical protein [Tissierellia bacterium]